jgi:hypothetical protein
MKFISAILLVTLAILALFSITFAAPSSGNVELLEESTFDNFTIEAREVDYVDPCKWGNVIAGKHGFGCYCASGCLDPTGVCDLPLGECHSGAIKNGITALGVLAMAIALVVSML